MISLRWLVRGLRFCAAAIALHGVLLGLTAAVQALFPGVTVDLPPPVGEMMFWILAVPALILAIPFSAVLWSFGLMNAPGWFAWPKPLGFALAYMVWIVVLLGLAWMIQLRVRRP